MIVITVEGGIVQEVYSDNPGEIVVVRDWDSETDGKPFHQVEETLDLKACDSTQWPDLDVRYYRSQEKEVQDARD